MKNKKRLLVFFFIFLPIVVTTFTLGFNFYIAQKYKDEVVGSENINKIDKKKVAIVFGAGLRKDGTPSQVLKDRVDTAVSLYKDGKVEKIIMSGDNRFADYNEPQAMINYAENLGVREEDLQPDYAGRRTYDTCRRAKEIFELDSAILVTQDFHMNRAMYLCESFGIDSIGVKADSPYLGGKMYYKIRDIISLTVAFLDVNIVEPQVVLGNKIDI